MRNRLHWPPVAPIIWPGGIAYFDQWWMAAFPGVAIFTVVIAFNFLGDGIRDALDPRLRKGV